MLLLILPSFLLPSLVLWDVDRPILDFAHVIHCLLLFLLCFSSFLFPFVFHSVMGESMDTLKGSCSQNTLKNERVEHRCYRQERNFIDGERLSGEKHSGVQKLGAPTTPTPPTPPLSSGVGILYTYVRLPS
jgi:hypothetical protein